MAITPNDLTPTRIELLKQAVPGLARIAILEDHSTLRLVPSESRLGGTWQAVEAAVRQEEDHRAGRETPAARHL